jgi:NCS1 nucleoside transporter family
MDSVRSENKEGRLSEYGIEQVSPEARTYGFGDTFSTWFSAGINTGSWYFGGLAAALGMAFVFEASFIWLPLIFIPMAMIGYIGYKHGASTVATSRSCLGVKGANITGLLQTIVGGCWPSVNSFIAAISMTYVFEALFGWAHYGQDGALWPMVLAILLTGITQGVISVVGHEAIRYLERLSAILLILLGIWMTFVVLRHWNLSQLLSYKGHTGQTRMDLIDYAFGFCWGWIMFADFGRFAKSGRTSSLAAWLGINVGQGWFILVGAVGVIAATLANGHFDPDMSDPSSTMSQLGLGVVAFLILIIATVSSNVANLYGAGIGLVNVVRNKSTRVILAYIAVGQLILCFIPLFFASLLDYFVIFLTFIGGFLVPLFTLIVVDYFLVRRGHVNESAMFALKGGEYWYENGWNKAGIAAFVCGSIVYFALYLFFSSITAVTTAALPAIGTTIVVYFSLSYRSLS